MNKKDYYRTATPVQLERDARIWSMGDSGCCRQVGALIELVAEYRGLNLNEVPQADIDALEEKIEKERQEYRQIQAEKEAARISVRRARGLRRKRKREAFEAC